MESSVPGASENAGGDGHSEDGMDGCRGSPGRASRGEYGDPVEMGSGRRLPIGEPGDVPVAPSGGWLISSLGSRIKERVFIGTKKVCALSRT